MTVSKIKEKLVKGGFWMGMQRMSVMTFNFVKLTVLSHFLSPTEFGIFGVALICLDILDYLTHTGFQQALIQKKGDVEPYLNSVWTFRLIRSVLMAAILFAAAPLAGSFFDSQESVAVIRAISFIYIIRAVANIADLYLLKDLNFKTYFFYNLGGNLADFVLAITFAVILKSYWALFIGYISRSILRCILSYVFFKFRPKFHLEKEKIKELFQFGKWILVSAIITLMAMYLDKVLVGKLIGITALGLYQVAFRFAHTGTSELRNVLSQIYFPYFSVLQDQKEEANKSYLNLLHAVIIISMMITTGVLCLSPAFTTLFMDEKWRSIIPLIQLLSIAAFIGLLVSSGNPFFKGLGKPKLMVVLQFLKIASLIGFMFILGTEIGVRGVAISVTLANIVAFIGWLAVLTTYIRGFVFKLIKIIVPPLLASLFMAGTISLFWILPTIDQAQLSFIQFFAGGASGTLVFVAFMALIFKIFPSYGQGISFKKLFDLLLNKSK